MHTFQPYPIDLMEMNPFTKIGKEWMLITAPRYFKAPLLDSSKKVSENVSPLSINSLV